MINDLCYQSPFSISPLCAGGPVYVAKVLSS
jgi:hypothetical protein